MGPQARQAMEAVAPGWLEEKGHLWHLMDHLAKTDKMWAQMTGQLQPWSLFAPAIGRECIFPAVEYHWDDDARSAPAVARPLALLSANNPWQVAAVAVIIHTARHIPPEMALLPSSNEPADLEHYLRIGGFRMRRYENNLVITLRPYENETLNETNERWSDRIRAHVTDYAEIIHGYLRWRVRRDMARWPGREQPRQMILVLRRYHINDYDETPPLWKGPYAVPDSRDGNFGSNLGLPLISPWNGTIRSPSVSRASANEPDQRTPCGRPGTLAALAPQDAELVD